MLDLKQNNVVFSEKDERPSRFLIDLKNISQEKDDKRENEFFNFFRRAKSFNPVAVFKDLLKAFKNLFTKEVRFKKVEDDFANYRHKNFELNEYKIHDPKKENPDNRKKSTSLNKISSWYSSSKSELDRLAFFPLIKLMVFLVVLFFKFLHITCFKIGYLFTWPLRILFIAFKKISRSSAGVMSPSRFNFSRSYSRDAIKDSFRNILKPLLYFSLFLIILILPFKAFTYYKDLSDLRGRVLGISEQAISDTISASESISQFNFEKASDQFSNASDNFLAAQNEISEISGLLKVLSPVIPNKDVKLAANADLILEAGRLSAELGKLSTEFLNYFSTAEEINNKDLIDDLYLRCQEMNRYSQELNTIIIKINPSYIPEEYKGKFLLLQDKSGLIAKSLDEAVDLIEKARVFLGMEYDKRYLLVFQNNTELRGSGGFIGSYAQVDFRNGEIKDVKAPGGGSYDTEAGLYERIIAPEPLHLVNPLWHFWDANWWPDWPTTARKLMWFYEKSDQSSVDGVIGITPTFVEDMLRIIGPLDMSEDYGVVITSDNFWEVVQNFAEQKPEKLITDIDTASTSASSTAVKHEPKKIIGDLISKIKEELPSKLNKDSFLELISAVENNLQGKHILAYLKDEELQKKIIDYDWGGAIKDTEKDYLMVVNTNIAGGKSDKKIEEKINHEAEIFPDGTIVNTLKITRAHTGIKNEKYTGVRNVDWLRVYVPEGSILIDAQGFEKPDSKYFEDPDESWQEDPDLAAWENRGIVDIKSDTKIYSELGKTVFANWSMVDPGESVTLTLKYKLPFKIEFPEESSFIKRIGEILAAEDEAVTSYSLLVQKQPGSIGSKFFSRLVLPENFSSSAYYPSDLENSPDGWVINDQLLADKFWAVLITDN